jgi:uncharacterized protein YndB with AHSA1/START domain
MREFTHTLSVSAAPAAVLDAFFSHDALAAWWHVTRSSCTPHPLGSYALEWQSTDWRDDTLGRLGGAFRGTVIEYRESREFFIADAYWLAPDGDPIGPMALEAQCSVHGDRTQLHVRQSGWQDNRRWTRYYDVLGSAFPVALEELRVYVEKTRP